MLLDHLAPLSPLLTSFDSYLTKVSHLAEILLTIYIMLRLALTVKEEAGTANTRYNVAAPTQLYSSALYVRGSPSLPSTSTPNFVN